MNKHHIFFKTVIILFVLAYIKPANAQRSRVDSIIAVLQTIAASKNIDSTQFANLKAVLDNTSLDNASINDLEITAAHLSKYDNIDGLYSVKLSIMTSLNATNKAQAIAYGKYNVELMQKSKEPLAVNIRSAFLRQLRIPYRTSNMLDEGFTFFNDKLKEYKLKNDSAGLAACYYVLGGFYRTKGLMETAIYNMKKAVSYMDSTAIDNLNTSEFQNPIGRDQTMNNISVIGIYYMLSGDYNEALKYSNIGFKEVNTSNLLNTPATIAMVKLLSGTTDSVKYLLDYALKLESVKSSKDFLTYALQAKAFYKIQTNELTEAEALLQECWQLIRQNNIPANAPPGTISPDYYLALIRVKQNRIPEAIVWLQNDLEWVTKLRLDKLRDYKLLAALQEQKGDFRQAAINYKSFLLLQDSLLQDQKKYSSLSFETENEMNEKELSINKLQNENTIASLTRNFIIGIAVLLLILAAVVYYRFKSKQKDNKVLEQTLANLKTTQTQLIQSEKMASLGELTAGIAHEIQNPLNFVNNFSEVNTELIEEMKTELKAGNKEDAIAIANDIADNEQKINHHGKRADAIVKGMLQHSRSSSGAKEPTDINALADEYLRLSYHGLRAKDKSFNATMETHYDDSIEKINIIPQDIGRVILNLITNAFYAVDEKKKSSIDGYEPTVSVSTKKIKDAGEIIVKDNGKGIPQKVLDKIFQPFFTTKPTGQGTGLGLSLSYDIVKAHGGELKVETREGDGSEFIILLPIS